jgi:hypothetical protein
MRWMTAAIALALPAFSWIASATSGTCTVAPAIVPMETDYTITATGLRPNASHGITIRQLGKGSRHSKAAMGAPRIVPSI